MSLVTNSNEPVLTASPLRRWVLVSSILASSMSFIDATALSVAMPALQAELGAGGTDLLWVTNGYSLPLASLLLFGGGLGDCYGRKRMFAVGIGVFSLASLLCGLAPSIHSLIAARVVQGFGSALMIPGSLSLLSTFFAAAERGKAIGTWSACSVAATSLGPLLGGLLARAGLWRWVFFINLPLAGIALVTLAVKIPETKAERDQVHLNFGRALLATLGLGGINYGLIALAKHGLQGWVVPVSLLGGVLALFLFIVLLRRSENRLLASELFQSRALVAASLFTLLFYTAFNGMLFFLPLNLIQVQGYDPALAGATQLPLMAMLVLLSRPAGKLVDRSGSRLPLTLGASIAGCGFLLLGSPQVTVGPRAFVTTFLPGLVLIGVGLGMIAAPLSTTVMASAPPGRFGLASGINSTLSRLAGVLAIAVLGPIVLVTFQHSLEARTSSLGLTPQTREQLRRASAKLAETKPPPALLEEKAQQVQAAVKSAFVTAFRVLAWITAGLSWLGAAAAARLLRPAGLSQAIETVRVLQNPPRPRSGIDCADI